MFGKKQYQGRHAAPAPVQHTKKRSTPSPVPVHTADIHDSIKDEKKNTCLRRISKRQSVPFYAALTIISIIAWLLPLRPSFSAAEKRDLAAFPSFSVDSLFAGEYFKEIETWFSDTFTFREVWIGIAQNTERLHGIKTVIISGNAVQNDDIPVVSNVDIPAVSTEINVHEEPLVTPEPIFEVSTDEEGIIQLSEEQLDEWKGLVIAADEYVNKASVLQIGSSTFEYPSFSRASTEQYAAMLNNAGKIVGEKVTIYSVPAPASVTYMLSREDREKYGLVLEEDAIDYCASLVTEDNVVCVNAVNELVAHNDEYLAFRTDPHWTAVGAYYAYVAWCRAASVDPVPLSDYTEGMQAPFYGTYYYNYQINQSLLSGDEVYTYTPPGDVHLYLNFSNNDRLGYENDLITKIVTNDKYLAFLTTDSAQAIFVNNDISDDSACVVYKTSFGNPFVYYLTQHYHTVYVMDIRSYMGRTVSSFIDAHPEAHDIILLNSFSSLQSTEGNQSLLRLLLR